MKTLATIMLVLLLAACAKLTVENYDKLKAGMSYEEVKQILGSPDRCSDILGVKSCIWGDDNRNVMVNFVNDKVLVFTAHNIR